MAEVLFDIFLTRYTIQEVANHLVKVLDFPKITRQYEIGRPGLWRIDYIYGYHPENPTLQPGDNWFALDGSPDFIVHSHSWAWEVPARYDITIASQFLNLEFLELVPDRLERSIRGGLLKRLFRDF